MQHWSEVVVNDALWYIKDCPDHVQSALKRMAHIISEQPAYRFRLPEVERYADEIAECTELTTLVEYMWRACTSLGFQHVTIFALAQGKNGVFRKGICTSHSLKWIRLYQKKRYRFIDPVVSMASQRDGSFLFSDLPSTPNSEAFWSDAERHRIGRNGLCLAVTRQDGARVGVSYSTSLDNKATEKLLRLNRHELECLAILAIDCFCDISAGRSQDVSNLTDAELRFLYLLSTTPAPTAAMKINNGFGSNSHLQSSIRNKLGVETIFQAVAMAAASHWFDSLQYEEDDVIRMFPELTGLELVDDDLEGS